jgi:hypothetical protein
MGQIKNEDISFVVQGAIDRSISEANGKPATRNCLESIRRWYPGAEIVLSTWEGSDVSDLDYDVLVTSQDPGAYSVLPYGHILVAFGNGNRQIVSTLNGLKQARRKFAVKLRADIVFSGNQWIDMWDRFPERAPDWRIFQERVIIANHYTRNPLRGVRKPFHPSDWFMFGLRQDLLLLWNVECEVEPESAYWFRTRPMPRRIGDTIETRRYHPEQYLWKTLISKFGEVNFDHFCDASRENIRLTQLTFANNLIILEPGQFPFTVQKPLHSNPKLGWQFSCYSHREWLRLYRHYCCGDRFGAVLSRMVDTTHLYEACYLRIPGGVRGGAARISQAGRQLINSVR